KCKGARYPGLDCHIADMGKALCTQQFVGNILGCDADASNFRQADRRRFGRRLLRKRTAAAHEACNPHRRERGEKTAPGAVIPRRVFTQPGSFTSLPPSRRFPTARPKINLLNQDASAGACCRAVRDSTPVAWYRSLYAPRTGGAYDSHYWTAGIAGCTRRRGSRLAARGARATGPD